MNVVTRVTRTNREESAVSPIVSVILMVAVTVILSATIGAFVLDLGQNVGDASASADLGVSISENAGDVEVMVTTGDADRLELLVNDTVADSKMDVSPGDTLSATGVSTGAQLTVAATSNGQTSVVTSTEASQGAPASSYDLIVAKDGSGDYSTVQPAIDASSNEDSILVKAGTYTRGFTVNVSGVTVVGEDGVTLSGTDASSPTTPAVVSIDNASDVTLRNVHINAEGSRGLYVGFPEPAPRTTIEDVSVENASSYYGTDGYALYFAHANDSTVRNATVMNNEVGLIAYRNSTGISVTNTEFSGNSAVDIKVPFDYVVDMSVTGGSLQSVDVGTATTLDVTHNWWGDTDPSDQITAGSGSTVTYEPYCTDVSCSSTSP